MRNSKDFEQAPPPPFGGADSAPAWELVEAGRYMPRRFKGSFRGRELG